MIRTQGWLEKRFGTLPRPHHFRVETHNSSNSECMSDSRWLECLIMERLKKQLEIPVCRIHCHSIAPPYQWPRCDSSWRVEKHPHLVVEWDEKSAPVDEKVEICWPWPMQKKKGRVECEPKPWITSKIQAPNLQFFVWWMKWWSQSIAKSSFE